MSDKPQSRQDVRRFCEELAKDPAHYNALLKGAKAAASRAIARMRERDILPDKEPLDIIIQVVTVVRRPESDADETLHSWRDKFCMKYVPK